MNRTSRSRRIRALALVALAFLLLLVLWFAWTAEPLAPEAPKATALDPAFAGGESASVEDGARTETAAIAADRVSTAPSIAVVRGRVTDVRTGEPVPGLDLVLHSGPLEDRTTTATDGSFESAGAYDESLLGVRIFDAGTEIEIARPKPRPPGRAWEIEVAIGPTVPVLIAVRDAERVDPAQWTARILETARPEDCAGEIQTLETSLRMLRPCEGCRDRAWPPVAVRPGPTPWIRYPRVVFEPAGATGALRPMLEVESKERVQRGRTRLRATVGIQPPVVVDPLERFVLLEGRVVDEHGEGLAHARVLALPAPSDGGLEPTTPRWRTGESDAQGRFELCDVALGRAFLCAWSRARPAAITHVHVEEGRNALEMPLKLRAERRPASGEAKEAKPKAKEVRAAKRPGARSSPLPESYLRLRLTCAGELERGWLVEIAGEGRQWRSLALADLPAGLPAERLTFDWIDVVDGSRGLHASREPRRGEITVPEHVDVGQMQNGDGLAFDRESGDLDRAWVSFEPGGTLVGTVRARELERLWVTPHADIDWAVWRRGSAPVFGRRGDLEENDDRTLVLRARAESGWGAVLWFRALEEGEDADSDRKPLEGLGYANAKARPDVLARALAAPPLPMVRVLAEGDVAATTDSEGVARVARARRPERLMIVADGWFLAALERLDPNSGAPAVRYVAWMERE